MLIANEIKVLRKIVGKTKTDVIRNYEIQESCGIQPISKWVKTRRRREWGKHVTRMNAERLVQISG